MADPYPRHVCAYCGAEGLFRQYSPRGYYLAERDGSKHECVPVDDEVEEEA